MWSNRLLASGWDPATVAHAVRGFERRQERESVDLEGEDEPAAPPVLRRCLTCRGGVWSTGFHHRMCDRCRGLSASPYAPSVTPDVADFAEANENAGAWGAAA